MSQTTTMRRPKGTGIPAEKLPEIVEEEDDRGRSTVPKDKLKPFTPTTSRAKRLEDLVGLPGEKPTVPKEVSVLENNFLYCKSLILKKIMYLLMQIK